MENNQYKSKDLELLKKFQASNQTISEAFSAKENELQACYTKGNNTQVKMQALIHHDFNSSVSSDEKFNYTIANLKSIAQYNKNYGSFKAEHSWQDWILDNAIPVTLGVGFSFLGGFVAGRYMQPKTAIANKVTQSSTQINNVRVIEKSTTSESIVDYSASSSSGSVTLSPVRGPSADAMVGWGDPITPHVSRVTLAPKAPFCEAELETVAEQLKTITKKSKAPQDSAGTPSKNKMKSAINSFVGKFTDKKGYTFEQRKTLEEKLKESFKQTFPEGTTKDLYNVMDKLFHSDSTLSIRKTDEIEDQFSELFEQFKESTSRNVNREASNAFGLGLEATAKILAVEDVDSAYMIYVAEVIIAGFIAANIPGANAEELKYNETVYAFDNNFDDGSQEESEKDLDSVEVATEEVTEISEEPTFAEKFQSKLPEYGEIIGVNFVSGALKSINYIAAICTMEMFVPGSSNIVSSASLAGVISEMTNKEVDYLLDQATSMFDHSSNGLSGEEGLAS